VIYYAPTIFQQAGFHSALSSMLATAGVGLVNGDDHRFHCWTGWGAGLCC